MLLTIKWGCFLPHENVVCCFSEISWVWDSQLELCGRRSDFSPKNPYFLIWPKIDLTSMDVEEPWYICRALKRFLSFNSYTGPRSTRVQLYYWWSILRKINRLCPTQTSCKKWVWSCKQQWKGYWIKGIKKNLLKEFYMKNEQLRKCKFAEQFLLNWTHQQLNPSILKY